MADMARVKRTVIDLSLPQGAPGAVTVIQMTPAEESQAALDDVTAAFNATRAAITAQYKAVRNGGMNIGGKPVPTNDGDYERYVGRAASLGLGDPFPVNGEVFYLLNGLRFIATEVQFKANFRKVVDFVSACDNRRDQLMVLVESATEIEDLPDAATIASGWPTEALVS